MEITQDNFKDEILDKKELVLLEFFGTWCMPCKMEMGILDKVSEIHGDALTITKLDLDKNMNLAKELSVMTVPTMILFKNGAECDRMVGFRQLKQINDLIDKYKNEK